MKLQSPKLYLTAKTIQGISSTPQVVTVVEGTEKWAQLGEFIIYVGETRNNVGCSELTVIACWRSVEEFPQVHVKWCVSTVDPMQSGLS